MADETAQETPSMATGPSEEELAATGPSEEELAAIEARKAKIKPLLDVVQSSGYGKVYADLSALRTAFMDEPLGFAHLFGVIDIMPRLKEWAENQ